MTDQPQPMVGPQPMPVPTSWGIEIVPLRALGIAQEGNVVAVKWQTPVGVGIYFLAPTDLDAFIAALTEAKVQAGSGLITPPKGLLIP